MKAKVDKAAAVLTCAERRAIDKEIKKQLAEYDKKHDLEIDALVLWTLREQFGFGEKRLKKFFDIFETAIDDLVKRYEMDKTDDIWLCTKKLKDYGVDLEEWEKERRKLQCL